MKFENISKYTYFFYKHIKIQGLRLNMLQITQKTG